jgi:hypothetical protein
METVKNLTHLARENKYVLCALTFLAIVGPGIVRLADMLKAVRQ